MPQLSFVKKFIEQFGGTVPAGDFQMPAGGKCPFGGDVKSESKSTSESHEVPEDMEDEEEDESEASDLELEMEESSNVIVNEIFKPNVIYIDEKPPKIVKDNITRRTRSKKTPSKFKKRKNIVVIKNESKDKQNTLVNTIKEEHSIEKRSQEDIMDQEEAISGDDPLFTPHIEIKTEIETEITELVEVDMKPPEECFYKKDYDRTNETDDNSSASDENPHAKNFVKQLAQEASDDDSYNYDDDDYDDNENIATDNDIDDDDEPLIMLTRSRGRPRKLSEKEFSKIKAPRSVICREICKQHCTQKFTPEERLRACDHFWSLTKEERVVFIRKHILAKRYTRLKRKKPKIRGSNCCYYLDGNGGTEGSDMIRVCRKYFEATLCLTSHIIKKALDGHQLAPEYEIMPLLKMDAQNTTIENKTTKEIQQILDPETGDLVTIDPNAKKKKQCSNQGPKKKRVRRKPGDPVPEHFPKPTQCEVRCIFKCHLLFTEEERKHMCDLFWSLDYKSRKDFILERIQTKEVETQVTPEFKKSNRPPRGYHTRFFLRAGMHGENKRVCKHFMLSTLCISRHFIENALEFADKTTGYYTGRDRRGHNTAHNKTKPECRKIITDHIKNYCTWVPNKKSKTRYLHHKLSIKQMYDDYKSMCLEQKEKFVSSHGYYKAFHDDFRLSFLCNPEPKRGGGFLHLNPNISRYTGEEPGGFWIDPNGEKLDITNRQLDLTQNFLRFPYYSLKQEFSSTPPTMPTEQRTSSSSIVTNIAEESTLYSTTSASGLAVMPPPQHPSTFNLSQPLNYAHFMDPSAAALAVLNVSSGLVGPPPSVVRHHDFNPTLYESGDSSSNNSGTPSVPTVFRRL